MTKRGSTAISFSVRWLLLGGVSEVGLGMPSVVAALVGDLDPI